MSYCAAMITIFRNHMLYGVIEGCFRREIIIFPEMRN